MQLEQDATFLEKQSQSAAGHMKKIKKRSSKAKAKDKSTEAMGEEYFKPNTLVRLQEVLLVASMEVKVTPLQLVPQSLAATAQCHM